MEIAEIAMTAMVDARKLFFVCLFVLSSNSEKAGGTTVMVTGFWVSMTTMVGIKKFSFIELWQEALL